MRSREGDVGSGSRTPAGRFLLAVCLGVVMVRLVYVTQPLRSDEGGYLLVARQWRAGGEFLYGDYHVDRPPLLMLVFRAAAVTEWDPMIRVLAVPFAVLFVVAAWHAGRLLRGEAGGRWSALVAAGLVCSPALAADQADGELFAAPMVMGALALTLAAWRAEEPGRQLVLAVSAGMLAGAAPLVKQNFLDGLVFGFVLLAAATCLRRRVEPREVTLGLGGLVGASLPHAAVAVWAASVGVHPLWLWQELAGFRGAAFGVIWGRRPGAAVERGLELLALGVVSGLFVVVVCWLWSVRPWTLRSTPEEWAVTGVLVFGLVGIAAGGSYWPHYLMQLSAGAALAAGALAPIASRSGLRMRVAARTVVAAAGAGTLVMVLVYASTPWVWFQQRTGEWLAASGLPGDTAFVAYGNPSMLETADMGSPYPYLWSVPMRTLDRDQARLRDTLAGQEAPHWIVQVNGLDSWGIDVGSRLRDLVEARYRVVAEVCGRPVWLRQDVSRKLAPRPRC